MELILNAKGRLSGDIRSSTIFISEEGQAQFVDPFLMGNNHSSFMKTLLKISKCPLAPEQLKALMGLGTGRTDMHTEVWAIGVLLLSIASLSSEELLYNWRNYEIDKRGLTHLLSDVQKRYTPLLFELTKSCLQDNPSARPSFGAIYKYIERRKRER